MMSAAMLAGACVIGAGLSGFASTDAAEVNAVDTVAAIQEVAPEAVAGAAVGVSTADAAAQVSTSDGLQVQVPVDAADGVRMALPGGGVSIGLPFADQATDAIASQLPGVVVYDNNNGSSTVPVVRADGTVQISTVIENANASKRYDYPITAGSGETLQLGDDGSVTLVDQAGVPIVGVAAPWARDANGNAVPTHYEVSGTTLTQVIDFTAETAFPVVADPTTGYYSYNCVLTNGSSYFMKPGEKLTNCKGSYLQKYINGKMVQSVSLVYNGKYTTKLSSAAGWCVVALTSVAVLAWDPPAATGVWLLGTAATLLGAYGSCVSL